MALVKDSPRRRSKNSSTANAKSWLRGISISAAAFSTRAKSNSSNEMAVLTDGMVSPLISLLMNGKQKAGYTESITGFSVLFNP
jgi:hypothetical protein